jgi:hypothetical protein
MGNAAFGQGAFRKALHAALNNALPPPPALPGHPLPSEGEGTASCRASSEKDFSPLLIAPQIGTVESRGKLVCSCPILSLTAQIPLVTNEAHSAVAIHAFFWKSFVAILFTFDGVSPLLIAPMFFQILYLFSLRTVTTFGYSKTLCSEKTQIKSTCYIVFLGRARSSFRSVNLYHRMPLYSNVL